MNNVTKRREETCLRKDLLEESLNGSSFAGQEEENQRSTFSMHCCEKNTRCTSLAAWRGALLYLFRVRLLPLE